MLDKRAETRSSFRRCSLFLDMTFILFFVVYFTAILARVDLSKITYTQGTLGNFGRRILAINIEQAPKLGLWALLEPAIIIVKILAIAHNSKQLSVALYNR